VKVESRKGCVGVCQGAQTKIDVMNTLFHLLVIIAGVTLLILTLSALCLFNTIQKLSSATDFFHNKIVISGKQLVLMQWQDMVTHIWMYPQKLICITDWAHH
jgi:hypothetical protein